MVKKETQYIRIGFFIAVALGIAMFIIFMIGSEKNIFRAHYTLIANFEDISGLRIGAPVQLAGMTVGFVDNIRFPRDLLKKQIEVTLKIADRYKERIRKDSIATINTQGLLGDKFIFVSIGSSEQPLLKDGEKIQTREIVGLFELAEKGGEILENIQKASESAAKFFSGLHEGRDDVRASLKSVRDILNQAEKGKGLIHALVYDPKGEEVLNNMASSMASLKVLLGQTEQEEGRRGEVKNLVSNLNKTIENLRKITEKIEGGEGTIGGLITDPSIYNDIRGFFRRANRNNVFKAVVRATLKENDKQMLK